MNCLAISSGVVQPLPNLKTPGKTIVSLRPLSHEDESCMLFRIVVMREPEYLQEFQEWWFAGHTVALRTQLRPLPIPRQTPTLPCVKRRALATLIQSYDLAPSKVPEEMRGVKL